MIKVRKLDYWPDNFIAAVAGVLDAAEIGVYWIICSLNMSHGGPIEDDADRIAKLCSIRPSKARKIIDRLVSLEKIDRDGDGKLVQKRVESDLKVAQNRIETCQKNGRKGGRPPGKNNDIDEPQGSFFEKPRIQTLEGRDSSLRSESSESSLRSDSRPNPVFSLALAEPKPPPTPPPDLHIALAEFNATAGRLGLPKATRLTPTRRAQLAARLKSGGLDEWRRVLAKIASSAFLCGATGWRANLDFVLQASSYQKILEGAYEQRSESAAIPERRAPSKPAPTIEELRSRGLFAG